ncbi:hypothetical protein AMAG_15947 [Allomyces macrogynus ATCC 38327]|uniref:U2A'/phosphoprotein 32 family A C-terminal domain-containing protein n=1 Tax=Allomyces macrogynus (strain ATCC 38327) TaxID=578462 RepID=A0A0L0TBB9_ALLM3|nr:hypothetical protein AMAG_15947 [Allomyces macrogynus ATCC 38327]|eukprot:KNE72006.1 hypothetical protein AMAG_15947 [Allomyces macrogynus ATCC 38327]
MAALPVPVDPYLRAVLYDMPARVAAATTSLVLDNHVLANDGADIRASSSPFTWIAPLLARFVHLESLSLVACALTTLDGFPRMPHLVRLSVADNPWLNGHLSVVARQCPGLRALDASNTAVQSVEEVQVLTALPHLATLSLVSCPVAATLGTSPTYRAAIFAAVPALDVLDGLDRDGRECDDENDEDEEEELEDDEDVPSSPPLNPGYYASTAGKGLRRAQKGGRSKGPPTAGKGVSRKFFGKGVPMKGGLRVGNGAAHDEDEEDGEEEEEDDEEEEDGVWSDHDDEGEGDAPRRVVTVEIDDSEDDLEDDRHDRRVEEIVDEEEDEDEVESSFHDNPVPVHPPPPRPTAAMHEVVVLDNSESDLDEESDYDDEDDEDSLIGIVKVTRPPTHPTHETADDLDDDEDEDDGYDEDDKPSEWSAAPAPPPAAPAPVVVELQDEDDEVEDDYDDDKESQFDELPARPAATATAAPADVYSDEYDDEDEYEDDAAAPNLAELYGDEFTNGLDASFSHDQLDEDDDAFDLADDEDPDAGVVPTTGKRAFDLSSDGLTDQMYKRARHGP